MRRGQGHDSLEAYGNVSFFALLTVEICPQPLAFYDLEVTLCVRVAAFLGDISGPRAEAWKGI